MIGSFGGFGGMGLGALSGIGGFAPTPEQIQERLEAAGIPSYTPPAPVVTPRPTPVVTPKPMPVMPIGGAYTSIGPNLRSAYTPTAPIAPPELKSRAPKPAPVTPPNRVGQPVSAGEFIPETTAVAPKPVTPPKRSPALQARLDEINAAVERKRQVKTNQPTQNQSFDPRDAVPNMTEFRKALRTGYTGGDVDRVDDFYNTTFQDTMHDPEGDNLYLSDAMDFGEKGAYGIPITKEEQMLNISDKAYFGQDELPGYNKSRFYTPPPEKYTSDERKAELSAVTGAIGDATSTDQVVSSLSSYYGADVKPIKETRKFGGDIEGYTSTSPELMSEFQSVIRPLMEEKIAYSMSVGKKDYHEAVLDAYNNDPAIRAVYDKYGVKATRTSARGSEYIYDPLGYRDSRVIKRSPALGNAIKMAATLAFTAGIGGALAGTAAFGGGASAAGTALAKGLTSAGITAATGGDGSDILKAGVLGGVGSYGQELAKASEAANLAAKGASAGSDLAKAAELAKKTSDTFNKVATTVKFVDAAIDGNIAGAAISVFGDDFTGAALDKIDPENKFFGGLNINKDDLTKGLVKTQLELAKGENFGDAMLRGFGEYIKEGGALGPNNVKTPEFIKKIGDVIKESGSMFDDAILQPVKGFVEGTVGVLGDVAEPVVDVIEDVAGAVVDKAPLIEDAVKATGSAIEDVVKPIVDPIIDAAPVVEDAVKAVGSTVDDVILQPAKELVEDVIEAAPDVDVDLPKVDLPRPSVSRPTPTQTSSPTPSTRRSAPRVIQERTANIFDAGEEEQKIDPIAAYLASITGVGMANGGAVRSSYGNLDELLRIVGGK